MTYDRETTLDKGLELTKQIVANPESDLVPSLLNQLDDVMHAVGVNFQGLALSINSRGNRDEAPLISDDEIMALLAIDERVINDVLGIQNS